MIHHLVRATEIFSNWRGERAKKALQEKYPDGIEGVVGPIYLTRAKTPGFKNHKYEGYVAEAVVKAETSESYPVVHQATFQQYSEFVLTLFPWYIDGRHNDEDIRDKHIKITKFVCVRHPFHFLPPFMIKLPVLGWIGGIGHSSTEVYPKEWEVVSEDS
ncbi:MAG: hypothetical protein V3R86_08140 [Candidatus Hydrothermarchaeaceae archaeon]